MDFATLQSRFFARGFEGWNDAGNQLIEAKALLNEAMHEINDEQGGQWPFLEATAIGPAPLSITDLGTVENVWDATHSAFLDPADRRDLGSGYVDGPLSQAGTPAFFYVERGTDVSVYPLEDVELSVRYWRVAPDLVADADVPLMPARFHGAIVDLAVASAQRSASNEAEAQGAQAEAQRKIGTMAERLLGGMQEAGPVSVRPYVGDD